jgi:hypothetical protein
MSFYPHSIETQIRGVGEQGITPQQIQQLHVQARSIIRVYNPDVKKLGSAKPITGREGTLWRVSFGQQRSSAQIQSLCCREIHFR